MSIRFKFRSAVNFDTVEIGDRESISVNELRAKILRGKVTQPQHQGFNLVFSDAISGLEYKDDDFQIPVGSSVIVKRVPWGAAPSTMSPIEAVHNAGMKNSYTLNPAKEPIDEFDDFGTDLCPILDSNLPHSIQEINKNTVLENDMEDLTGLRLECQNLDSNNISEAAPRGSDQTGNEKNILLEARVEEQRKLSRLPSSNFFAGQNNNLPLELKCSLCNNYFREAVMIPCCQHSFCENCIRLVLIEKRRCPKCFSGQCTVGDLLPNLSLRKAVEHFLESQMLDAGLENQDLQKYVPDGESGIQAEDFSCGLTVVHREPEIPQSSCATGKGSNQVFESFYEQQPPRNVPFADSADSSAKRKEGFWRDSGGGDRNFFVHGGHRKGIRTCYTCGSPDHLMRDCPASNLNAMFRPGHEAFNGWMPNYTTPYGSNCTFPPPFRPYANMYANYGLIPFNASMVPVGPYTVPHISSVCGGFSVPSVNLRMGNMGPPRYSEFFGLQHCENRSKLSNQNLTEEQLSDNEDILPDGYRYGSPEKAHDHSSPKGKEPSLSLSGESFSRRSTKRKHDKYLDSDDHYADEKRVKSSGSSYAGEKRPYHSQRSKSSIEDLTRSSDRPSEGRHKHHHGESKYHDRMRRHEPSDDSFPKDFKGRGHSEIRDAHRRHHSYSKEADEPSSAVDGRRVYKERNSCHDSRHSKHISQYMKR